MKKFILFSVFSFLFFTGNAQIIPNANFEDWGKITFSEDPDSFQSTNILSLSYFSVSNVVKTLTAKSGKYGILLTTHVGTQSGSDTVPGGAFTGSLKGKKNDPKMVGGYPWTERPDSIGGYYYPNLKKGDSAYIRIIVKKSNGVKNQTDIKFGGNDNVFHSFKVPLHYESANTPDSIFIGLFSGNPLTAKDGSSIIFDSLYFTNCKARFPNGDFEKWKSKSMEYPLKWDNPNLATIFSGKTAANKVTDAVSGKYALQLESVLSYNLKDTISYVTSGYLYTVGKKVFYSGGFANTQRIRSSSLNGYFKYFPQNGDSATVIVEFRKHDVINKKSILIGKFYKKFGQMNSYSKFSIPTPLTQDPDSINIVILPTNYLSPGALRGLGCLLYIDSLYFENDSLPRSEFSASSVCFGDSVRFKNTSMNADTIVWYFGDGGSSVAKNPVHKYGKPGVYKVLLLVTNKKGIKDTSSKFISVYAVPKAHFSVKHAAGTTYLFTADDTTGFTYDWQFGDGFYSVFKNPQHTFLSENTFKVSLVVKSKEGCKSSFDSTLIVTINSIGDIRNSFNVDVHPNPVSEELYIETESGLPFRFEIRNLSGQLIQDGDSLSCRSGIDTRFWTPGLYFVEIITEKGIVQKKVMK